MLSGGKDTMVFVNNFYFNKVSEIYYVALDLELRRSPGERNGYPLQYSGLENSMDSIVHGVTKSQPQLRDFHFLCIYVYICMYRHRYSVLVTSVMFDSL